MTDLLDSNALIYLLDPRTPPRLKDRLEGLLQEVEKARGQVIIPTSVVTEYLSGAGPAGLPIFERLSASRAVQIAAFDYIASIECAAMQAFANDAGDKRYPLGREALWQKVKIDRQIVAIAKTRAARIVSDDDDIYKLAKAASIECVRVMELPLPDWAQQLQIAGLQPIGLAPWSAPTLPLGSQAKLPPPAGSW